MASKVHVKKGDTVVILSGKDKDKKGKVLNVFPADTRVLVDGINIVKKHSKPSKTNPQGGVIEQPAAISSAKVMVVCDNCNKPTRIAKKVSDDGEKIRVCKHCGRELGR